MHKQRYEFIDLLRGIAVILMFITHSYRLQISTLKDQWLSNQIRLDLMFNFFMNIEPFTSALFLFLAGYSMFISYRDNNDEKEFSKNIFKKSIILIIFSVLLNFFSFITKGIFIDHLILSSGILQAIAISLLLNLFLLKKKKSIYVVYTILIIAAIAAILEYFSIVILGLNAGAGCLVPVIGFSLVGHLASKHRVHMNIFYISILAIGIYFGFAWRYDVNFNLYDILSQQYKDFSIWNHSLAGFIMNSSILLIISSFICNSFKTLKIFNFINQLGKHSLTVYVYHLTIIGMFYFNSVGLSNPTETFLFIIGLIFSSQYLIKIKKRIYGS